MKVRFILLLITYLLAFSVNFIPSIKHPDSHMNIWNLLATSAFILSVIFIVKESKKKLKIIGLIGMVAGVIIFVITMFEDFMLSNIILNMVASIQHPLYLIFITPLFGANLLFDVNYGLFSLFMSVFYVAIFILNNAIK